MSEVLLGPSPIHLDPGSDSWWRVLQIPWWEIGGLASGTANCSSFAYQDLWLFDFTLNESSYATKFYRRDPPRQLPQSRKFGNFRKLSIILRKTIEIPWALKTMQRLLKNYRKFQENQTSANYKKTPKQQKDTIRNAFCPQIPEQKPVTLINKGFSKAL